MDQFPLIGSGPGTFSFQPMNMKWMLKSSSNGSVSLHPSPRGSLARKGQNAAPREDPLRACYLTLLKGAEAEGPSKEKKRAMWRSKTRKTASRLHSFKRNYHPDHQHHSSLQRVIALTIVHVEHCPWRPSLVLQHFLFQSEKKWSFRSLLANVVKTMAPELFSAHG